MYDKVSFFVIAISLLINCEIQCQAKVDLNKAHRLSDFFFNSAEQLEIISIPSDILIRDVSRVAVHNGIYYFLDKLQSEIFGLNSDGELLLKLDKMGVGPGEYRAIEDFDVNEKSIVISSNKDAALYLYDFTGEFKSKIRTEYPPNFVSALSNKDYFVYNNYYPGSRLSLIHI